MHRTPIESLELRTLLDATLENGRLTVTGTEDADTISVTPNNGDITVDINGTATLFDITQVDEVLVNALGGDDTVTLGVNLPTTVQGGAGADTITGGEGADSVIGGPGADVAMLGAGDDTFVWNPGDGSDFVDGQDGADTMIFNGSAASELFTVAPAAMNDGRVLFTRDVGNIEMDMGTTEHFVVNALGGNDTLAGANGLAGSIDLRFDGGDGDDSMSGTDGADTFIGGGGNDTVDGNGGADTADLGDGNDLFIWDPGDGSDIIEGGANFDTLLFNGSGGNEVMEASANGERLRFTRDLGNIIMDAGDLERLDVLAMGGNDTVTIGDLRNTPTFRVFVDGGEGNDVLVGGPGRETFVGGLGEDVLRGNSGVDSLNGGLADQDDNEPDRVLGGNGSDYATFGHADRFDLGESIDELIFRGTGGSDFITVDFRLANNLPRVRFITPLGIQQAILSNGEIVQVQAGSGNDTVVTSPTAADVWAARFLGGSGHDLLIGGKQNDTLLGETGNDTIIGLEGDDELDPGSGRGQIVLQ